MILSYNNMLFDNGILNYTTTEETTQDFQYIPTDVPRYTSVVANTQ